MTAPAVCDILKRFSLHFFSLFSLCKGLKKLLQCGDNNNVSFCMLDLSWFTSSSASWSESDSYRKNGSQKDEAVHLTRIIDCDTESNGELFIPTFEYAGRVMLRLQMALWVRLRYVRASFVKDSRPHGSCVVSRICLIVTEQLINSMTRIFGNPNLYLK